MLSENELVSCSCECKTGSEEDEKVTCVHTVGDALDFAHFCLDGFVEHLLYELSARWPISPSFGDKESQIREDLYRLMSIVNPTKYAGQIDNSKSVADLLTDYSVGTERPKGIPRPPPHDTVFKPLRTYTCSNPAQKSLDITKAKLEPMTSETRAAATTSSATTSSATEVPLLVTQHK